MPIHQEPGLDLERSLRAVVGLQSSIPEDAFTAPILGTERAGSGVVIREDGLVLTIGYLITEAETVWLTSMEGRGVPGHPLAYDQETGFGLVQALGRLDLPALDLGDATLCDVGDPVVLAGGGGKYVQAGVVSKHEFAGYWEYLLEEAIFTTPAHPLWGGAALIGADGRLLGIGSLLLQMADGAATQDINMVVPINLLTPILDDLLRHGQVRTPPRPWLGLYAAEREGTVVVLDTDERGPAAAAGVRAGDILSEVRDQDITGLADFYRKIWACGPAGTEIALRVVRGKRDQWVRVRSTDRATLLRKPLLH
jgi:S1-C subfamily serine protease